MDFISSSCESGEADGKSAVVKPKDLRFTQLSISRKFSDREHPTVEEAVDLIEQHCLKPEVLPKLTVYRDRKGVVWCKNNRRLYVLRKAGVSSVQVVFTSNDSLIFQRLRSRELREKAKDPSFMPRIRGTAMSSFSSNLRPYELREKAKDPSFMPRIRGTATSSSSSQLYTYEGETQSPMLGYPIVEEELRSRVEDVKLCDDSRRVYGSVNGYMPRRLEDPAFMPKITDAAPSSSSSRQQSHEEEKETSFWKIVGTASVAVAAGFAAWKLFMTRRTRTTRSDCFHFCEFLLQHI